MTELETAGPTRADDSELRVMTNDGPLGSVRLTMRKIGQAEGFIFCRHGSLQPLAMREKEWLALPVAECNNYDV